MRYTLGETCVAINRCQRREEIRKTFKEISKRWWEAYSSVMLNGITLNPNYPLRYRMFTTDEILKAMNNVKEAR